MQNSGGEGEDPIFIIPTVRLFELYRMENPEVEELTDNESKYLQLLNENMVFQKSLKGTIKSEIGKLNLADSFGWSERAKQKDELPVDYVSWNFDGLLTENTSNHEGESLENEAIKNDK